jgi:hypothetical protein
MIAGINCIEQAKILIAREWLDGSLLTRQAQREELAKLNREP